MQNFEQTLHAMITVIAALKKTQQGFTCLETDFLGMGSFLSKQRNNPLWKPTLDSVHAEVEIIQNTVEAYCQQEEAVAA
ncbi:MAG: hypothetical protein WCG98_03095 [bacterium]